MSRIHALPPVTLLEILADRVSQTEVKLQYVNKKDFESIAKRLKIMPDLRVSIFRMLRPLYKLIQDELLSLAGWCTQDCVQRDSQL